ncbi:MAG: transporter, partial [Gammaproteobacteria bacterium]|nr:transporter [Gammaproteobacteria bacterium]
SGIIVIMMALYFKSLVELSLFDLMMSLSAMIQVPLLIPLIVGLFVKKTPQWAPWVTVALGLSVSWIMNDVLTPQVFADWVGLGQLTGREATDLNLMLTLAAHILITAGFFCATTLFYREENDHYRLLREDFFKDLETPVIADAAQDDYDQQQRNKLGTMVIIMGAGILVMSLIPNPLWGRMMFVCCALVISTIGFLLKRSARAEPGPA